MALGMVAEFLNRPGILVSLSRDNEIRSDCRNRKRLWNSGVEKKNGEKYRSLVNLYYF